MPYLHLSNLGIGFTTKFRCQDRVGYEWEGVFWNSEEICLLGIFLAFND